jgi:hypothetical protein
LGSPGAQLSYSGVERHAPPILHTHASKVGLEETMQQKERKPRRMLTELN